MRLCGFVCVCDDVTSVLCFHSNSNIDVGFLVFSIRRSAVIARDEAQALAAVTNNVERRSICHARSKKIVYSNLPIRSVRSVICTMASKNRSEFMQPMKNVPFALIKWVNMRPFDRYNRHAVRCGSTKDALWRQPTLPDISSNVRCAITRINFGRKLFSKALPYRTREFFFDLLWFCAAQKINIFFTSRFEQRCQMGRGKRLR